MRIILIIWSVLFFSVPAFTAEDFTIGKKHHISSNILDERRSYYVSLPASYDDERYQQENYPVVYILDGDRHFQMTSTVIRHMAASFQIPEMIVVAISTPKRKGRIRDLSPTHSLYNPKGQITEKSQSFFASSGGGDNFLKFIQQELIPKIDNKYRTMPYRIFAGHSLGGLAVIHSLFSQDNLFQNYIALDPSLWWQQHMTAGKMRKYHSPMGDDTKKLYLSLANHDLEGHKAPMRVSNMAFKKAVLDNKYLTMKVKFEEFEDEDHNSIPLISFYSGLRYIFKGYKPDDLIVKTALSLSQHFELFSKERGMVFIPPEQMINFYARHQAGRMAKEFLELGLKHYPNSPTAIGKMVEFKQQFNYQEQISGR